MKISIEVGEKHIDLVCNAFTPILFKQIFRRDFMVEFSNTSEKASNIVNKARELAKLQKDLEEEKVTKEEYLAKFQKLEISTEGMEAINSKVELISMLTFVMNKQSEETDIKKLYQLSELDYFGFLSQFEKGELTSPEITNKVIALWKGDSKPLVEAKNV